jgi:hypothetical protein
VSTTPAYTPQMLVEPYRVVARNPAADSENRIHGDDIARRYGFRGGLVPGVTVYAYACGAALRALGPAWVEHGSAALRFQSPCYDGEELAVAATPGPSGAVDLTVTAGQRATASGWAAPPGARALDWAVPDVPAAPAPRVEDRPEAGEESLAEGRVLGSVSLETGAGTAGDYLEQVGEVSPLYAEREWLHPALILQGANRVLMASVVLPAWLHVETEIRHLRAVRVGEDLLVRGRVGALFARGGHRLVRLDVLWSVDGEPVAAARHTAIWRIAERN